MWSLFISSGVAIYSDFETQPSINIVCSKNFEKRGKSAVGKISLHRTNCY